MPDPFDLNKQKQAPGEDVVEEGQDERPPTQSPDDSGEGEASGSAPIPTSDDDVLDMVKETIGEEPKEGETVADMVNKAERDRRIGPDEEETKEERQ
ncbi:MAG: hypothetical protein HYU80_03085 [Candidatus Blackburnbacteria bacterium]|nr:hypothetical protein [Candidatus Blackburnbacteria bacterium]